MFAFAIAVLGGTFTDDDGTAHTWAASKPTIVTGAFQAFTLMDMGLPASQIHGTFGQRGSMGSNVNGVYSNSNSYAHHGDHASTPYDPTLFPADPSFEETAIMAHWIDLAPNAPCSNGWCPGFNTTVLDIHGWPDVIVAGPYWFDYFATDAVKAGAEQRGIPIIHIGHKTTGDLHTTTGDLHKTFLEMAQSFEGLAAALGADTATATFFAKKSLCLAASAFKETARAAAERGVRALAGYIPYGNYPIDEGKVGAFLTSPQVNPALSMLEQLGMPILHVEHTNSAYYEYQIKDWVNGTLSWNNLKAVQSGAPYAVDFFLYEPRGALDFTSDAFATAWPHPAVVAKQYAYYPQTTLHYSYNHAAEILTLVGDRLATAQKLDPAKTQCTAVEVLDGEHHRTNKLAPGQYACHNPVAFAWCEAFGKNAWQVEALANHWKPCPQQAAARARRLSVLEAKVHPMVYDKRDDDDSL